MPSTKSRLQQQPVRIMDRQQQQSSGSNEFQPRHAQYGGEGRVNQADGASHERSRDGRHRPEH